MNPANVRFLTRAESARLASRPDRPVPAHLWSLAGYKPNEWAYYHLHTSGARFNSFATSRQVGKTHAITHDILDAMTEAPREDDQAHGRDRNGVITDPVPPEVGVISDTFDHCMKIIEPFTLLITRMFGEDFFDMNKNEHWLRFKKSGATLRWLSAESPRSGQGNTFSRVYIDEAQNVSDEFFTNLRPTLGVRMARLIATGTPDPVEESTWFQGNTLKAWDVDDAEAEDDGEGTTYYAYSVPCYLNKWLPRADIRDALESMSEREFRMKYLGQWVKHEGAVFKDSDRLFNGEYEEPLDGVNYAMGLDLAKQEDYTVAYVMNRTTRSIAARWRINHLSYVKVADEVSALARKYRVARLKMDSTGVGEPVADMLRAKGMNISPFIFNNKSKDRLVSTLAREVERGRLILPKADTTLKRELNVFARKVSKAGNVQYSAPTGYHDDAVMALGLTVLAAESGGTARSSSWIGQE